MREMMKQLERSLIGPVNVFEHEEHRLFCRKSLEHCEDHLEWTLSIAIGCLFSLRTLELRENRCENCAKRSKHLRDCFAFALCNSKSKRIHQRCVWHR
jgi:hypothetical protein